MAKPVRTKYAPTKRTLTGALAPEAPRWLVPLIILIVILIIVAIAVGSCQSCQQQPQVEDGVKTTDKAIEAGGVTASGGTDVQTAFAAYSWDELKAIAQEIKASGSQEAARDIAKKYHLVNDEGKLTGDCKPLTLTDGTLAAVQIVGFYHDDLSDGSGKAGMTFITRDTLPEKQYMNISGNNIQGWEGADLRATLGDTAGKLIPAEVSDKIVAVNKATNNVGITEDPAAVTQTSDSLWLFSKAELCERVTYDESTFDVVLNAEGTQYQLFADAAVTDKVQNALLAKNNNGEPCIWWTRTSMPDLNTGEGYYVVLKAGITDVFSYLPSDEYGVVLGFCL